MSLSNNLIICKKNNCGIQNSATANYCKQCGELLEKNSPKGIILEIEFLRVLRISIFRRKSKIFNLSIVYMF